MVQVLNIITASVQVQILEPYLIYALHADVISMNNPITNTLPCYALGAYTMSPWGVSFGITLYIHILSLLLVGPIIG